MSEKRRAAFLLAPSVLGLLLGASACGGAPVTPEEEAETAARLQAEVQEEASDAQAAGKGTGPTASARRPRADPSTNIQSCKNGAECADTNHTATGLRRRRRT